MSFQSTTGALRKGGSQRGRLPIASDAVSISTISTPKAATITVFGDVFASGWMTERPMSRPAPSV